jgi:carbohydrate-binding DOMON domain-containing protein
MDVTAVRLGAAPAAGPAFEGWAEVAFHFGRRCGPANTSTSTLTNTPTNTSTNTSTNTPTNRRTSQPTQTLL